LVQPILCLTVMEAPTSLDANDVRAEKIKVLRALRPITAETVKEKTVRGQYARGKVDGGVAADYMTDVDVEESNTETYVAIKAEVDNWRWAGVPIYLRTGKRMSSRRSEIVIQFKSSNLCPILFLATRLLIPINLLFAYSPMKQ